MTSVLFLIAQAIALPDHKEVSNARCGRPQWGGVSHKQTKADKGYLGVGKQVGPILCGRPLCTTHKPDWSYTINPRTESHRSRRKISKQYLILCFLSQA